MGLLVTLYLIMVNTYSTAIQQTPNDRDYGYMEMWLTFCQGMVFLAMLQYSIILYHIKHEHTSDCGKVSATRKVSQKSPPCCKNRRFDIWDRWSLILMPTTFGIFNIVFWVHVSAEY